MTDNRCAPTCDEHAFQLSAIPTHSEGQILDATPSCLVKAHRLAWDNGLLCGCIATLIFSFSSLQVKLTGGRVPVLELCIIRSSLSWCTSIAVGAASRISPLFGHRQHFRLLFLRGFFGTLAITTSYIALLTLPLGDAVTVAQMRPPVTAVMAQLLLNERLGPRGLLGCLVSVVGVTILAHPPFLFGGHDDWGQRRLLGTLCGVLSTLFASGTSYCVRKIGTREPALVVALYFHTVTIALMAPPLLLGFPEAAKPVAHVDCLLLLGIAASSFCAQLLMTRSFQLIPAAKAAAVSFMGVLYSHILGWFVFHEHLTTSALLGGVLIFIGVLLVTVKPLTTSPSGAKVDIGHTTAAAAAALTRPAEERETRPSSGGAAAAGDSGIEADAAEDCDREGLGDRQRLLNGPANHSRSGTDNSRVGLSSAKVPSSNRNGVWPTAWLRKLLSNLSRPSTNPDAHGIRLLPVASCDDFGSSFAHQQQGSGPGGSGYSICGGRSTAGSGMDQPLLSVTPQHSWTSAADSAQQGEQAIDDAGCDDDSSGGGQTASVREVLEGQLAPQRLPQHSLEQQQQQQQVKL